MALQAGTMQGLEIAAHTVGAAVRAGFDPLAGAGAVVALGAVVGNLAVKAMYNKEQVKSLASRVKTVSSLAEAYEAHLELHTAANVPLHTRQALEEQWLDLKQLLERCKKLLRGYCKKGENPLGLVKRFLQASFYHEELNDIDEGLTGTIGQVSAMMTTIGAYHAAMTREELQAQGLPMQQAAAADRQAFEGYLLEAVGGIQALREQMRGHELEWQALQGELASNGVFMQKLGAVLEEMLGELKELRMSSKEMARTLEQQSETIQEMRDVHKDIDIKVDLIMRYVQALQSQKSVLQQESEKGARSMTAGPVRSRLKAPNHVVNREDIDVVLCAANSVGQGGAGVIYKGSYGPNPVAVKRFELSGCNDKAFRQVFREAIILGQLSHPNIVQLYGMVVDANTAAAASAAGDGSNMQGAAVAAAAEGGSFLQQSSLHGALVMELMDTDLNSYLGKHEATLSLRDRLLLATKVACALHYLHNLSGVHAPIVHGDLKPQNCLVQLQPLQVKLCDFGLSCTSAISRSRTTLMNPGLGGSLLWLAPEIFEAMNCVPAKIVEKTTATDVFAFGLLMYEIVTGQVPYGNNPVDILRYQVPNGLQPEFKGWEHADDDVGRQLIAMMKRCWMTDPKLRPGICELYEELQQLLGSVV